MTFGVIASNIFIHIIKRNQNDPLVVNQYRQFGFLLVEITCSNQLAKQIPQTVTHTVN